MKNPCIKCEHVFSRLTSEGSKRHYYICNKNPDYTCQQFQEYRKWLETQRKYQKGSQIMSLDEMMKHDFVYLMGGIRHMGFVRSMTLRTINLYIERGFVFEAVKKESED